MNNGAFGQDFPQHTALKAAQNQTNLQERHRKAA
jgi:hypothetical protein